MMDALGKSLGYTGEECPNCGRIRVEAFENGLEICDKCNWSKQLNDYFDWNAYMDEKMRCEYTDWFAERSEDETN